MDLTGLLMRQNPAGAAEMLVSWAKRRLGLDWTSDKLMRTPPGKVREELLAASKAWYESGKLEHAVNAAQACKTDADLERHFNQDLDIDLPDWMRYLEGQERQDAIRARVESALRAELVQFEQQVLLHTLDDSWKGHLYAMDQLRDVINFRAYSQQDPRIEYKREGSRMFGDMLDGVRDRITDDIFKVRLVPQLNVAPPPAAPAPRAPSGDTYYSPPTPSAPVFAQSAGIPSLQAPPSVPGLAPQAPPPIPGLATQAPPPVPGFAPQAPPPVPGFAPQAPPPVPGFAPKAPAPGGFDLPTQTPPPTDGPRSA
jgi:hypothetical protein